jgi:3-phenylpropionate/trans-cinnamate dioxygenase ferredoxin subunit
MADYVSVGKVGDFPANEMKAVDVNGENVAVVKIGDKFHAFSNYCTHVGVYMTGGYVTETEAVCDLHGSVYELETGKVTEGPAFEPLAIFKVRVEGEDVLVGKE